MSLLPVAVVAATGRLGRVVVDQLLHQGIEVVAIGRDQAKLATLPPATSCRVADLTKPGTIRDALRGSIIIVSCANAMHVPVLLSHLPDSAERIVVMGSTRRFSKVQDATTVAVRRAEEALDRLALPHVMLLSTMIYGGGDSVLDAWAKLIRRYPILPVPAGQRSCIQPIHIDDVARSIIAATRSPSAPGAPIVIAGAEALTQQEMIRRIALALKREILLVPIPAGLIEKAASFASIIPGWAGPSAAIKRLVEDRAFDITAMESRLGISPRPLNLDFLENGD